MSSKEKDSEKLDPNSKMIISTLKIMLCFWGLIALQSILGILLYFFYFD
jgi:hypothetical protein